MFEPGPYLSRQVTLGLVAELTYVGVGLCFEVRMRVNHIARLDE